MWRQWVAIFPSSYSNILKFSTLIWFKPKYNEDQLVMYWKTPFRVNKSVDSPISTIQIDVDTLREVYLEVLFLHRLAIILDY